MTDVGDARSDIAPDADPRVAALVRLVVHACSQAGTRAAAVRRHDGSVFFEVGPRCPCLRGPGPLMTVDLRFFGHWFAAAVLGPGEVGVLSGFPLAWAPDMATRCLAGGFCDRRLQAELWTLAWRHASRLGVPGVPAPRAGGFDATDFRRARDRAIVRREVEAAIADDRVAAAHRSSEGRGDAHVPHVDAEALELGGQVTLGRA